MGEVIHSCLKEGMLATHDTQIKHLIKSVAELDRIYDLIYGLTTSISVMSNTMIGITEDVGQIKRDVIEIKTSDVASNVLVLTEQMERNIKDIADTQIDVRSIQSRDSADYIHYKRSIVVFVILAILGVTFAKIGLK